MKERSIGLVKMLSPLLKRELLVAWIKLYPKPNQTKTTVLLAARIHGSGNSTEQQKTRAREIVRAGYRGSIRIEYTPLFSGKAIAETEEPSLLASVVN